MKRRDMLRGLSVPFLSLFGGGAVMAAAPAKEPTPKKALTEPEQMRKLAELAKSMLLLAVPGATSQSVYTSTHQGRHKEDKIHHIATANVQWYNSAMTPEEREAARVHQDWVHLVAWCSVTCNMHEYENGTKAVRVVTGLDDRLIPNSAEELQYITTYIPLTDDVEGGVMGCVCDRLETLRVQLKHNDELYVELCELRAAKRRGETNRLEWMEQSKLARGRARARLG